MSNYSVYVHTNKINGKRYVGVTMQVPERRWQKGYGYVGTPFGDAIAEYGWNAFDHQVILGGLTKEQAFKKEIELIAAFESNNPDYGYNVSAGGYADDCIPKLCGLDHWHHASVRAVDPLTGLVVYEFDTQTEAAKVLGISRKGITKACRGQCQTYKGLIWEYSDRKFVKPITNSRGCYDHKKQRKAVKLTDVDGTVYIFNSLKSAAAFIGVKQATVSRYLSGLRRDLTGRRWSYAALDEEADRVSK